jgi:glycosyltransferase involved in cell wall biosynthesis
MAAHQAERTIGAAVASVLWQTYDDLELVVVDDGSTDATAGIAEAHAGPVRVVRREHGGVSAARNRLLEEARGELVTFCDADDLLFPRHVEALVEAWERDGGIVTANAWLLFPGGIQPGRTRFRGRYPPPERQRRAILEQNVVSIMSILPRTLAAELGPFREDLRTAEDWDFWIRAVLAGTRLSLQPEPLACVRWGATGLTAAREQMDADAVAVLRGIAERDDLTEDERAYLRRRLSAPGPRELARSAEVALREGRYGEAARDFRRAAALVPSERPLVWKARALSLAPPLAGRLARARQARIDRRLGLGREHLH